MGQTESHFVQGIANTIEILNTIVETKYAQHLGENRHSIGPINESMTILHTINKGRIMDKLGRFDIYNVTKANNQINDGNTVT